MAIVPLVQVSEVTADNKEIKALRTKVRITGLSNQVLLLNLLASKFV